MMIGSLGDIPFYVAADESALLSGLSWSSGARYAEHTRHGETDMLEYVGNNPDQISFDIKLSAFLGVNPSRVLERLRTIHKEHKAVKFALGTLPIPGHWVLSDMDVSLEHFHKDGTLLSADVQVKLQEYVPAVSLPVITSRISFVDRLASSVVVQPAPAASPSRKPVVPATTKAVSISPIPTTKPKVTAAGIDTMKNIVKKVAPYVAAVTDRVVTVAKRVVGDLGIVPAIKEAFTKALVPEVKKAPAKPMVVKKSPTNSSIKNMIN